MDVAELLEQYLYGRIMIPGRLLTAHEAGILLFMLQLYGFKPQVVYTYPISDPVFAELMVAVKPEELDRMYIACMTHGFSFVQVNSSLIKSGVDDGETPVSGSD